MMMLALSYKLLSGSLVASTMFIAIHAKAATTQITNLKFSRQELSLLKRLNQIQSGAGISSTMLKAAPFVELFSSPAPVDMAITIGTNDWDHILGALKGLRKIQACQTVKEIDLWRVADGNNYSSAQSKAFFSKLSAQADAECK